VQQHILVETRGDVTVNAVLKVQSKPKGWWLMEGRWSLRTVSELVAGLVLATLFAGSSIAQELRGRVQGLVTDPTEAVVAGASVTLRNVNTGVDTTRETNQVGHYVFDYVSPGTYTVTVELQGFNTFVQQNILVETRGDVTVNAALRVGAVAETINVREAPVAVQFNTSTMELTVDTKMANDLPIIHRNVFLLAALNPAVVIRSTTEQAAYHLWAPSQLDVGGNTNTKNDLLVDGTPQLLANKSAGSPPMDAVSELNVQQNGVDAEFGHSAGGIISLQLKSGTNQIHGTAYYLGRNPKLNAVANSTTHTPNLVRNHIGGASIGLPIKKNKIFNFTAYERWLNIEPRTAFYTMPTALERQGNFSQSRNINGGLRQIYDPFSTKFDAAANTSTRDSFPNNTIPQSRLDPTALKFLGDVWQANNPGDDITGVNNYKATSPMNIKFWNATSRTDFYLTDNWKTFFRWSQFRTFLDEKPSDASRAWGNPYGFISHSFQLNGDAVWTINPTTVFNVRAAYVSIHDSFDAPFAELKESDLASFWPGNPWYKSYLADLPKIYYPSLSMVGTGGTTQFGLFNYWWQQPKTWNLSAKISKQISRHYVKTGGEYRNQIIDAVRPRPGGFSFSPNMTANTFINPNTRLSGDPWATFLVGAIDDASVVNSIPLQHPRVGILGFFVQDDFKVNQRLTLNLGLRYEFETPMRDVEDRLSRYLDLTNPIPEFQSNAPQLPAAAAQYRKTPVVYNGAWIFADSSQRGSWNPQKTLFLPRVGAAYRVNDRTAVRVGWARYVIPPINADGLNILGSVPYPGFDATTTVLPSLEGVPQSALKDPFPANSNPLIPPVGKSRGRYTNLGGDTTWFHQDYRSGVNDRINFSVQRQLPARVVLDVTYFLSLGRDHHYDEVGNPKDWNQMDPQLNYTYQAQLASRVPNPFYKILTPDKFPGQLRNQSTVAIGALLKPYPQYGALTERFIPNVHTRYQSLQWKAQRPFANGLTFSFGYNYNRERRDEFYDELDRFNNQLNQQESPNFRHRLTFGSVYELPIGRNRLLLANAHPVVDAILGGWSISEIYTFNSGVFLRFGAMLASGNPAIDNPSRAQMFDTSKFTRQPAFTRRTNPLQFPGVTGPGYKNLDLTLAKTYRITERLKLEMRMEAYNASNSFMGASPNLNVDSSLFGRVVAQRGGTYGRQFQYSARLIF